MMMNTKIREEWNQYCINHGLELITTYEDGEYCAHLIDKQRNRGYMALDTNPDDAINYVINAHRKSK